MVHVRDPGGCGQPAALGAVLLPTGRRAWELDPRAPPGNHCNQNPSGPGLADSGSVPRLLRIDWRNGPRPRSRKDRSTFGSWQIRLNHLPCCKRPGDLLSCVLSIALRDHSVAVSELLDPHIGMVGRSDCWRRELA